MAPMITVLMSVYNCESFLDESVSSILNQTYKDFSFLIFEDKSKDNSRSILQRYAEMDSRIKLICNEENRGLTRNLIDGINMADGKYIARMDADDISMPDRFAKQVEYMESHPEVGIVGTGFIPFLGDVDSPAVPVQENADEIKVELLLQYTLFHPTVMLRKSSFVENGLNYNAEFRYSQDFDLWERAAHCFPLANINIPLVKIRSDHTEKITTNRRGEQAKYSNRIRKRQLDQLGVQYEERELAAFNKAGSLLGTMSLEELMALDELFYKIISENKKVSYYEQKTLEHRCEELFRYRCINAFSESRKAGRYYYRSYMRKYGDTVSLKQKLLFLAFALGLR